MDFKQYFQISDNKDAILRNITSISRKHLFEYLKRFTVSLGNKACIFSEGKILGLKLSVQSEWTGHKVKVLVSDGVDTFTTSINPVFFNSGNVKNYFKETEIALKKKIISEMKNGKNS